MPDQPDKTVIIGRVCKCERCGHAWASRVPRPERCPRCLSYKWAIAPEADGPDPYEQE